MSRLASVLLAGVAALVAVPALAADLPAPVPSAPAPVPVVVTPPAPAVFDWTGLYVGANVGYAFGGHDEVAYDPTGGGPSVTFPDDLELHGLFGGVQAGFNWQFGNIVAGVEADFQLADIGDTIDTVQGFSLESQVDWFGTVRGRIGYAFDRALVYATGGLAYGHYSYEAFRTAGPTFVGGDDATLVGWTAGAGLEYAFTDNLSAKIEYLYVDLGSETFSFNGGTGPVTTNASANFHLVRLGINYRF